MQSDSWHEHTVCLKCRSQVRHRLFKQMLDVHPRFNAKTLLEDKTVLHFAPDEMLRPFLKTASGTYTTADLLAEGYSYSGIDRILDITSMQSEVSQETYDALIAMDVLEHVPDDRAALREIHRVLKKGGHCVLTVPQDDHAENTDEDASVTDSEARRLRFGQSDHVRIYGKDIVKRMEEAGFQVHWVDEKDFPADEQQLFVLFPPKLSGVPHATNFRKIYIGIKK
ncbi:MAG: class I SAM-dependent methyltransferase [Bacteroidia bacterium]|nr:class I SAM-dependent methyltransferase [Bacteroidia bacterium]